MSVGDQASIALEPAKPDRRFISFFGWYCRRLFAKKFASVRLAQGSRAVLDQTAEPKQPLIIALNHASWWDPLLGVIVVRAFCPDRSPAVPIDLEQFRRFKFFSKLGLFGISQDHPGAAEAFLDYVSEHFDRADKPLLVLTPQGTFTDVRAKVRVKPGVAAVAAAHPSARVLSLAVEYAFWQDQRPEVFLRARVIDKPDGDLPTSAAWLRAINRGMQANADELAKLVIARDPLAFESMLDRKGSVVHPVYDALMKLRGQDPEIVSGRNGADAPKSRGSIA